MTDHVEHVIDHLKRDTHVQTVAFSFVDERRRRAGEGKPEKAAAALFIEEMGKTGHARLINLAAADKLAPLSPGDQVVLTPSGDQLVANVGEEEIGQVEIASAHVTPPDWRREENPNAPLADSHGVSLRTAWRKNRA